MTEHNLHPIFERLVSRIEREEYLHQRACVLWMTGLSGSGKSTIASGVERVLFAEGYFVKVLDGDNIRAGINNNLTFTEKDRKENIRRIAEVAKLFVDTGIIVICSFISPAVAMRELARDIIGTKDFREIYINTPLEICESRDVKGLYKKARAGEIKGFTGVDAPYEAPTNADLEIRTEQLSVEASIGQVVDFYKHQIVKEKGH